MPLAREANLGCREAVTATTDKAGAIATQHRTGAGILLTLLAMFLFASMDAVSKVLVQTLTVPQILWFRFMVFTLLAMAVLYRRGLRRTFHSGQPLLQCFRALLIVVENGIFVLAFRYLPLADAHAILAATPLIVIALSVLMLGEKVGLRRWLAVVAGFAGVLLIVRPGFREIGPGILIALIGTAMWGLYQILVRMCARTDASETTWLWSAVVGLCATTLVGPSNWVWPDTSGWLMLVAVALIGSFGHLALIKSLSLAEASALQPYSYTLFLWVIPIGYLCFDDIPDVWTLAGGAVILAAGIYAWHRERVRAGERRTDP